MHEEPNLINKVFNRNTVVIGITSDILDEIRVEAAEGPTRSRRTSVMSDSDYQPNDAVESAFKRALKKAAPNMEMVEEEQSESSFAGSHRSEVKTTFFFKNYPKNLAIATIISAIVARSISRISCFWSVRYFKGLRSLHQYFR